MVGGPGSVGRPGDAGVKGPVVSVFFFVGEYFVCCCEHACESESARTWHLYYHVLVEANHGHMYLHQHFPPRVIQDQWHLVDPRDTQDLLVPLAHL